MKVRVLPLAILGVALLLVLKVSSLLLSGHYVFVEGKPVKTATAAPTYRPAASAHDGSLPIAASRPELDNLITGSAPPKKEPEPAPPEPAATEPAPGAKPETPVGAPKEASTDAASPPAAVKTEAADSPLKDGAGNVIASDVSPAERALLERLRDRRQELDARSQDIDMREGLLAAAEKRLAQRISEIKEVEPQAAKQDVAAADEEKKIKDLVTMYESMKPKEAARIFDRLDMPVLVEVFGRMNPKKSGEIAAKMEPESAQRLTVALARRGEQTQQAVAVDALPKISGTATP